MMIRYLPLFLILISCTPGMQLERETLFNHDWEFIRDFDEEVDESLFEKKSGLPWEKVSLPHTANIEPLVIADQQWQGTCVYRKFFKIGGKYRDKHLAVRFEGAMHEADVYLNGRFLTK